MFLVPINYFAILLCGIAAIVIGYLWYGPLLGKTTKPPKGTPKTYSVMFVSALVMAYALAHFVWYAAPGSLTLLISLKTATWAWLGFVATTSLSRLLLSSEKKSINLLAIDTGYYLVTLLVMAAILFYSR